MAWAFLSIFKGNSGEVQLGITHTIQSHGRTLAKSHKHDWLILLLLIVIDIGLNVIHPFYRFVGKDMMTDLKYPMKSNTVPIWSVPIYAVLLPVAIFVVIYLRRRDVYDLHHGILGLLYAVLITGVITDAIKDATGRPRPNFFWRCFPDGVDIVLFRSGRNMMYGEMSHAMAKEVTLGKDIRASRVVLIETRKGSFAGLGFLSFYLSGKIKAFDRKGHIAKLCLVFLPLLAASLVAVSCVDDYWHHWTDVFTGGLIGLVIAAFCYLQFFPPPYHLEGWGTYAYIQAMGDSHTNSQPMNGQDTEVQNDNQQSLQTQNQYLPTSRGNPFEDVEVGSK